MPKRGRPVLVLTAIALGALALGGCGMRGPLYLPPPPGPAPSTVPDMPLPDRNDSRR
ncbi:MAG: lipoprotein [Burkholderiaceae bacterium]